MKCSNIYYNFLENVENNFPYQTFYFYLLHIYCVLEILLLTFNLFLFQIVIPDEGKLPENSWAKRVDASVLKTTVIRHVYREGFRKKAISDLQEDRFLDLPVHQADVSVCTEKNALNMLKKA